MAFLNKPARTQKTKVKRTRSRNRRNHGEALPFPVNGQRLMMRGVRLGGGKVFQLELFGGEQRHFAPLSVQMSLQELGEWLETQQEAIKSSPQANQGPTKLHAV